MAHDDNIVLPLGMSLGSGFGPTTNTQVLITTSGFRKTNTRWAQKLRRFDIGYNVKTDEDIYVVLEIFEAVDGPANSFNARAWNDWNTTSGKMKPGSESLVTNTDQPMVNQTTGTTIGDAAETDFQLVKDYTKGSLTHRRDIKKPQSGTVVVALDGAPQTEGVDYTINYTNGIVTFTSAPGAGVSPTWGGAFYVPVAFVNDEFIEQLDYENNQVSIILMEVRL